MKTSCSLGTQDRLMHSVKMVRFRAPIALLLLALVFAAGAAAVDPVSGGGSARADSDEAATVTSANGPDAIDIAKVCATHAIAFGALIGPRGVRRRALI